MAAEAAAPALPAAVPVTRCVATGEMDMPVTSLAPHYTTAEVEGVEPTIHSAQGAAGWAGLGAVAAMEGEETSRGEMAWMV